MRQMRREVGLGGLGVGALGVLCAMTGAALSRGNFSLALMFFFAGLALYVPGALLAVSHFGFKRGEPLYLAITLSRLILALSMVIILVAPVR